jgi:hypothetical protein
MTVNKITRLLLTSFAALSLMVSWRGSAQEFHVQSPEDPVHRFSGDTDCEYEYPVVDAPCGQTVVISPQILKPPTGNGIPCPGNRTVTIACSPTPTPTETPISGCQNDCSEFGMTCCPNAYEEGVDGWSDFSDDYNCGSCGNNCTLTGKVCQANGSGQFVCVNPDLLCGNVSATGIRGTQCPPGMTCCGYNEPVYWGSPITRFRYGCSSLNDLLNCGACGAKCDGRCEKGVCIKNVCNEWGPCRQPYECGPYGTQSCTACAGAGCPPDRSCFKDCPPGKRCDNSYKCVGLTGNECPVSGICPTGQVCDRLTSQCVSTQPIANKTCTTIQARHPGTTLRLGWVYDATAECSKHYGYQGKATITGSYSNYDYAYGYCTLTTGFVCVLYGLGNTSANALPQTLTCCISCPSNVRLNGVCQ